MASTLYTLKGIFLSGGVRIAASAIGLWPRLDIGDDIPTETTAHGWLLACVPSYSESVFHTAEPFGLTLLSPGGGRIGLATDITVTTHKRYVLGGGVLSVEEFANGAATVTATYPVVSNSHDAYVFGQSGNWLTINGANIVELPAPITGRWGIYILPSETTRIGPIMEDYVLIEQQISASVDVVGLPDSIDNAQTVYESWPLAFTETALPLWCQATSDDGNSYFVLDAGNTGLYPDTPVRFYWLYPSQLPPAKPESFQAQAATVSTIEWTWSDLSSYEDGFYLYTMDDVLIAQLPAGATTYIEEGLAPGLLYRRKLIAYNVNGLSEAVTAEATTDSMAPEQAKWATAVRLSATKVGFAWSTITNAADVEIFDVETGMVLAVFPVGDRYGEFAGTVPDQVGLRAKNGSYLGGSFLIRIDQAIRDETIPTPVLFGYPSSAIAALWTWNNSFDVTGVRLYNGNHEPILSLVAGQCEYFEEGLTPGAEVIRYARFFKNGQESYAAVPVIVDLPNPDDLGIPGGTDNEVIDAVPLFVSGVGDGDDGAFVKVTSSSPEELSFSLRHEGKLTQTSEVYETIDFQLRFIADAQESYKTRGGTGQVALRLFVDEPYEITVNGTVNDGTKDYAYATTFTGAVNNAEGTVTIFDADSAQLLAADSSEYTGDRSLISWTVTPVTGAAGHTWDGRFLKVSADAITDQNIDVTVDDNGLLTIDPTTALPGSGQYAVKWNSGDPNLAVRWAGSTEASPPSTDYLLRPDAAWIEVVGTEKNALRTVRVNGEWFSGVVNKDGVKTDFKTMIYLPLSDGQTSPTYGVEVSHAAVSHLFTNSGAVTTTDNQDTVTFNSLNKISQAITVTWTGTAYPFMYATPGTYRAEIPLVEADPLYQAGLTDLTVTAVNGADTKAVILSCDNTATATAVVIAVDALLASHHNWHTYVCPGRVYRHQVPGVLVGDAPETANELTDAGYWIAAEDDDGAVNILPSLDVSEEGTGTSLKLRYREIDRTTLDVKIKVDQRWVPTMWSLTGRTLAIYSHLPYSRISCQYRVLRSIALTTVDGRLTVQGHALMGPLKLWRGISDVRLPLDVHPLASIGGGYLVLEQEAPTVARIDVDVPGGMVQGRTYTGKAYIYDSARNPIPSVAVTVSATGGTVMLMKNTSLSDGAVPFLMTPNAETMTLTFAIDSVIKEVTIPAYSLLSVARMRVEPATNIAEINEEVPVLVGWVLPRPAEASYTPIEITVSAGTVTTKAGAPGSSTITVPPRPDGSAQVYVSAAEAAMVLIRAQAGDAVGSAILVVR